jgi:hypothetical protein
VIDSHRVVNAFELLRAQISGVEVAAGQPFCLAADDDSAGLGKRLQARGNVWDLAQGQILTPCTAAHLAHDDEAGMNADTHR